MTRFTFLLLLLSFCVSLAAAQSVRAPAFQARVGVAATEASGAVYHVSRAGALSDAAGRGFVSGSAAHGFGRPSLQRPGGQVSTRVGTPLPRLAGTGLKRIETGLLVTADGPEVPMESRFLYGTRHPAEQANGSERLLRRVGTVMSLAGIGLVLGSFLLLDSDDARRVRYAGAGTLLVGSALMLLSRVREQLPGSVRGQDGRAVRRSL